MLRLQFCMLWCESHKIWLQWRNWSDSNITKSIISLSFAESNQFCVIHGTVRISCLSLLHNRWTSPSPALCTGHHSVSISDPRLGKWRKKRHAMIFFLAWCIRCSLKEQNITKPCKRLNSSSIINQNVHWRSLKCTFRLTPFNFIKHLQTWEFAMIILTNVNPTHRLDPAWLMRSTARLASRAAFCRIFHSVHSFRSFHIDSFTDWLRLKMIEI